MEISNNYNNYMNNKTKTELITDTKIINKELCIEIYSRINFGGSLDINIKSTSNCSFTIKQILPNGECFFVVQNEQDVNKNFCVNYTIGKCFFVIYSETMIDSCEFTIKMIKFDKRIIVTNV